MVCFARVRFPTFPLEDGITSLKTQFELEYWPSAEDTQYNGRITQKLNTSNPDKTQVLENVITLLS
jgi:hypothetical protein